MQYLESIANGLAFFTATSIVIIAILNFILKMRILNSGLKDEQYIRLLSQSFEYKESALKWAMLFFFGGLGLVIIYLIPGAAQYESPLPYGIEAIFLSGGFISYYLAAKKNRPTNLE